MLHIRTFAAVLFMALAGAHPGAHDFWLAADPWAGATVTVTANVGDHFPAGTSYTTPDRVGEWRLVGPSGAAPLTREFRKTGESLAADVRLSAPGAYYAVMTVQPRVADMKGPSFTTYLQEEGLDAIVAARAAAGETEKTAKEKYARYSKVALRSGAGAGDHLTRPVGLEAEFVPATDPTQLHPGQPFTVQLLAHGKPVPGAAVAALNSGGGARLEGRTDADGRVTLQLDRAGGWLLRTVYMERRQPSTPQDPDWESYWVTLSFHTASH